MRPDSLTYQRATQVSIGGFALQLIVALTVTIFGVSADDDVTRSAGYFLFLGLPVWATLVILFHQHQLARIEALETEQIARDAGRSTSVFETGEEDLRVAGQRLRWMHRFLVPTVGVLLALGMLGLGWWLKQDLGIRLHPIVGSTETPTQLRVAAGRAAAWGLAISVAVAALSYIFSRYVSGLARQREWQFLRAGATVAVSNAILNAALAAGHGFAFTGNTTVMHVMGTAVPVFMLVVGAEVAVNFVLNLYRPRQPGVWPRAAFDSRILSLVAEPDSIAKSISEAVNYQFGFEVTTTWFYRLVSRLVLPLAAFCVALLVLINCVAVVRPYEQGFLLTFGRMAHENQVLTSGPVLKAPWQTVERYPVHHVHEVFIGVKPSDPKTAAILWGQSHSTTPEDLIIVAPSAIDLGTDAADSGASASRTFAVLNAEVPVQYRIRDTMNDRNGRPGLLNYVNFIGGDDSKRDEIIREVSQRVITRYMATQPVDDVLGPSRIHLAQALQGLIQTEMDGLNAGVDIVFVGVAGIHPPVDVAPSFEAVLEARQKREAVVQQAMAAEINELATVAGDIKTAQRILEELDQLEAMGGAGGAALDTDDPAYAARRATIQGLILEAGGAAAEDILGARADRWSRHLSAQADTTRLVSRLAMYKVAPDLYRQREFLLRMGIALSGTRLIVTGGEGDQRTVVTLEEDPTLLDIPSGISAATSSNK